MIGLAMQQQLRPPPSCHIPAAPNPTQPFGLAKPSYSYRHDGAIAPWVHANGHSRLFSSLPIICAKMPVDDSCFAVAFQTGSQSPIPVTTRTIRLQRDERSASSGRSSATWYRHHCRRCRRRRRCRRYHIYHYNTLTHARARAHARARTRTHAHTHTHKYRRAIHCVA